MAKKDLLEVGQTVWLETTGSFWNSKQEKKKELKEMIVLEANKTSAYIWYKNEKQTKARFKVNQRTHQVAYGIPDGQSYRLWLTLEDYNRTKAHNKEVAELRNKLRTAINAMTLEELRSLNDSLLNKS